MSEIYWVWQKFHQEVVEVSDKSLYTLESHQVMDIVSRIHYFDTIPWANMQQQVIL